ncbi:FAD-dependent monooxygenase [Cyanobium sp. WAJ14-Wanaka]|uniref:FAD-dependent monooxygenase n=1 Tax=Cyanobium sp. WAJ14-Wanaka TaxID=2823725 RepID=UPI0020CBAD01|nr:FAD-dependent monooxygenase [Cyanobium sp. WAJ14-Wanaka]MCP9776169.1 FAD-dependent monooxygenase [Cyanobium sp. WAJ14-Wanaka]
MTGSVVNRSVVIVGAGPTGACLALMLCRQGIPVSLVESNPKQGRPFRGEALMPSGLGALDQMGLLSLIDPIPHRELKGWRFVLNRRELFRVSEPLGPLPAQSCTLVSQEQLIDGMLEQAASTGNLGLIANRSASALKFDPERRINGIRLSDGSDLAAALVVACDGRQSRLRQLAQISLEGGDSQIDLLWFQLPCPEGNPLEGQFTTLVGEAGLMSLFESCTGSLQLGWVISPTEASPQRSQQQWLDLFASLCPPELAQWLGQQSSGLKRPRRLSVQVGQAERWWRPGLLLLGDAAHPMSPVRAQGINMALKDAWIASQELVPALLGAEHHLDQALACIEARRRPEISKLQALQAEEARRGKLLQGQGLLRCALSIGAPLVGPAIGRYWSQQQQPLRQGISEPNGAMMG